MTTNHEFYNLNATRGYPLDDSASGVSDAGESFPDGILTDCCLRFPASQGSVAFISAINVTSRIVTLIISASNDIDAVEFKPIASLSLAAPLVENRPYALQALIPGVSGWVVFGDLSQVEYSGRFSRSSQSMLMPKTARFYEDLPVTQISRNLDIDVLIGDVGLLSGSDIEVKAATRVIDGQPRDAIVFSVSGDKRANLIKYAGPCGGRPESGTCLGIPIEKINDVQPDSDGNIIINFKDIQVNQIPHGLLVSSPASLPEICGSGDSQPTPPEDFCISSELSEPISEISEHVVEESETVEEIVSESLTCFDIAYPVVQTFHLNQTLPFIAFPKSNGLYNDDYWSLRNQELDPYPFGAPAATYPCSLSFAHNMVANPTTPTRSSMSYVVYDDECYTQTKNMIYQTSFSFVDRGGRAVYANNSPNAFGGLVIGAGQADSVGRRDLFTVGIKSDLGDFSDARMFAAFNTASGAGSHELSSSNILRVFGSGGRIVSPSSVWWRLFVKVVPSQLNQSNPTLVSFLCTFNAYASDVGVNSRFQFTVHDVPNFPLAGSFGFAAGNTPALFSYLTADRV